MNGSNNNLVVLSDPNRRVNIEQWASTGRKAFAILQTAEESLQGDVK